MQYDSLKEVRKAEAQCQALRAIKLADPEGHYRASPALDDHIAEPYRKVVARKDYAWLNRLEPRLLQGMPSREFRSEMGKVASNAVKFANAYGDDDLKAYARNFADNVARVLHELTEEPRLAAGSCYMCHGVEQEWGAPKRPRMCDNKCGAVIGDTDKSTCFVQASSTGYKQLCTTCHGRLPMEERPIYKHVKAIMTPRPVRLVPCAGEGCEARVHTTCGLISLHDLSRMDPAMSPHIICTTCLQKREKGTLVMKETGADGRPIEVLTQTVVDPSLLPHTRWSEFYTRIIQGGLQNAGMNEAEANTFTITEVHTSEATVGWGGEVEMVLGKHLTQRWQRKLRSFVMTQMVRGVAVIFAYVMLEELEREGQEGGSKHAFLNVLDTVRADDPLDAHRRGLALLLGRAIVRGYTLRGFHTLELHASAAPDGEDYALVHKPLSEGFSARTWQWVQASLLMCYTDMFALEAVQGKGTACLQGTEAWVQGRARFLLSAPTVESLKQAIETCKAQAKADKNKAEQEEPPAPKTPKAKKGSKARSRSPGHSKAQSPKSPARSPVAEPLSEEEEALMSEVYGVEKGSLENVRMFSKYCPIDYLRVEVAEACKDKQSPLAADKAEKLIGKAKDRVWRKVVNTVLRKDPGDRFVLIDLKKGVQPSGKGKASIGIGSGKGKAATVDLDEMGFDPNLLDCAQLPAHAQKIWLPNPLMDYCNVSIHGVLKTRPEPYIMR
jgi:hypothetical protein